MNKIFIAVITTYQKIFSPDIGMFAHGSRRVCVFYPTCSEYAKMAIQKYGFVRGIFKSTWRILRCHPWQKKHVDMP